MSVRKGDSVIAGNQVLYSTTGQHTNGAMTQKAATDSFLNKNQISNCITEIPQDIKLELNDGTLTLKAGSKLYVPNGVNTFDVVNITTDEQINNTWGSANTGMVFYGSPSYIFYPFERIHSGSTNPTGLSSNSHVNYNTTDGYFYHTTNGGSSWVKSTNTCLPLACVTWGADNKITSIDQVFNGFGYIGSTVFVLPNVKGLIPNGRNADGSLNNTNASNNVVHIYTATSAFNAVIGMNASGEITCYTNLVYDSDKNYNYQSGARYGRLHAGTVVFGVGGKITSFTPKTTFHALDYIDTEYMAHNAMPSNRYVDLTLGSDGNHYTAPADGWLFLNKTVGTTNTRIEMWNSTINFRTVTATGGLSTTGWAYCSIPVNKGDDVQVSYTVTGTTNYFRFIYANGAK